MTLLELDAARLTALEARHESLEGLTVVEGACPPDFLLAHARAALTRGEAMTWHGPFLFVDEGAREVVGSGGFKGPPLEGAVELGYGVAPSREGRGWATAGTRALVELAFRFPGVETVRAETALTNRASERVLEKAGFAREGQRQSEEDGLVTVWRLARP